MNPIEMCEMHCKAMEQKYGILYPIKMNRKELEVNCAAIDNMREYRGKLKQ